MTKLYIVATPIGNLEDITLRALRILKEVDFILCEDTRQTKKLLTHYNINTPVLSYHQHSKLRKVNYILSLLQEGKNLALVSDAGTPGISDPGNKLISLALDQMAPDREEAVKQLRIVPIPGPSAVIAALSVSGFLTDKFIFLGFPPHKKGRQKFFKKIAEMKYTVCFYESPYRILKTLEELDKIDELSHRQLVLGRELTKKFETIYRGTTGQVLDKLKGDKIKGEFVIVINSK